MELMGISSTTYKSYNASSEQPATFEKGLPNTHLFYFHLYFQLVYPALTSVSTQP